jgi:hypothetical protein
MPSKFVKPPLEEVIATKISSDDTHNTYQLVTSSEFKPTEEPITRPTKRPYIWPINPTSTTRSVTKKTPFTRITKKPYPYSKMTRHPILSLTTPTTTTPASTTVYLRNPGPLIQAFPLSLSNMPFFDFVRSQIFPRIGLSLLSFMATSPLLLTLLGAGAVSVGRRKRDSGQPTNNDLTHRYFLTPYEISKIIYGIDKKGGSKATKKQDDAPVGGKPTKPTFPTINFSSTFTHLLEKLFSAGLSQKINSNSENDTANKKRA